MRLRYLYPNFKVEEYCKHKISEIISKIRDIRDSDTFLELAFMLDNNDITIQEIAEKSSSLLDIDKPKLYVGTIHSVKGLEFDSVYVYGVNSNNFKIVNEDMRNLYYVACTRPKKLLTVITD